MRVAHVARGLHNTYTQETCSQSALTRMSPVGSAQVTFTFHVSYTVARLSELIMQSNYKTEEVGHYVTNKMQIGAKGCEI